MSGLVAIGNCKAAFYRRIYNTKASFPKNEEKLNNFRSGIAAEENTGIALLNKKAIRRNLRKMETLSLRIIGDLRDAMRAEPDLKLPSEVLGMLLFTNLNSRFLLSRLGKLQMDRGVLMPQEDAEYVEGVLGEIRGAGRFSR